MADTAPLIFAPRLGGLFPASPAAEKAMADVKGNVRVKITRMQGNHKRIALYWITLGICAPMLSAMCEGDAIDDAMLHRILKDRRGLYTTTTLPSGEVVKNYDSISFAKMSEPERNEYISWAFETLSKWLGVPVEALTTEARAA
ncbi:hypothetical protein sphantq_02978 [Sphingobium sp. AntQ-1]|uniref:hypothetical protein n=1 Tax=Sphingobium sp. AntQ-1 TaxID=2930091 RepID=UPI00234EBF1E|nr:hypothetical protein [Sphingobium sp. AntQ-1]WCP14532.1 hypothetical protein sphantq_02978 [Sphingobium sp. AntQ-1]